MKFIDLNNFITQYYDHNIDVIKSDFLKLILKFGFKKHKA